MVERDRYLSALDESFVHDVEHLEERHVRTDILRVVLDHRARRVRSGLPPHMKRDVHLYDLCESATFSNASGSLCRIGGVASPPYSQAATYANFSSWRSASPSAVWCSVRKCPPHDSSRCSASIHISSASSRKSATRPACSRA